MIGLGSKSKLETIVDRTIRQYFTVKIVFVIAVVLRVSLLLYGEWQDANFAVKFTDVDYQVFNDAAEHVARGKSPFQRPTYRYTPLLAFLLVLNHHLFFSFGKIIFVLCDLFAGLLMLRILKLRGVGNTKLVLSLSLWLLNPLTAAVSSRGNAESILAVLILLTLYFLMCKKVSLSAICFGLAVHMKIFPIIYSLSLYLFIDGDYITNADLCCSSPLRVESVVRQFFSPQRLKFASVSVLTFISITAFLYTIYGDEFIQEAYLYHITRRDTRHNFSVYFYMLYLVQNSWVSVPIGVLTFVPQAVLLLAATLHLYRDITLCCFVETFVFVTFNKVCTSQYFLWYLCLLPLVTPYSRLSLSEGLGMICLWFLGQVTWLSAAYFLEFQGHNTFIFIWLAGLCFFLSNIYVLVKILMRQDLTPTFIQGKIASVSKQLHISKLK